MDKFQRGGRLKYTERIELIGGLYIQDSYTSKSKSEQSSWKLKLLPYMGKQIAVN